MELVSNKKQYWEFIRQLRNMDGVKQGFINQQYITADQHQDFMKKYFDCFFVCVNNQQPVGYVGVINDDIRVATHPDYQGQGVGVFMINQITKKYPLAVAKIKLQNEASLRLFEKCGFIKKYYILERENVT